MVGRTNVGGGGAQFRATLEVTTDPNAVITATNPAGDSFSGTADSSGELTMTIKAPGTYTITETDGGVEMVVIADNEETYSIEVKAFDGTYIDNGVLIVGFESVVVSGSASPTVERTTFIGENTILVTEPNDGSSSAIWRSGEFVDISEYTDLHLRAMKGSNLTTYVNAYSDDGQTISLAQFSRTISEGSISLENLSRSKKYKFGTLLAAGNSVYIMGMKLE